MKFAKVLSDQAATVLPGALQSLFPYKALKKDMKIWATSLEAADDGSSDDSCRQTRLAGVQHELLRLLGSELRHLNQIFMEREELLVISWQLLSEEVARTVPLQHQQQHAVSVHGHHSSGSPQQQQQPGLSNGCMGAGPATCCHSACADADQLQDLLQLLVNFHGDAVLLMNWSHVNYNAVAKALKKFDKKFGTALRAPVMQQVVAQSFCSTGVVSSLTHRAEQLVNQLTAHLQEAASQSRAAGSSHQEVGSSHREAATQGPIPHTSSHMLAPESPQKVSSSSPASGKRPRDGTAVSHRVRAAAPAATAAVLAPRGRRSVESASRRSSEDVAYVPGEDAGQMAQCAVMSRRVQAALDTWHTLAVGASTPSTVVAGPAASVLAAHGAAH